MICNSAFIVFDTWCSPFSCIIRKQQAVHLKIFIISSNICHGPSLDAPRQAVQGHIVHWSLETYQNETGSIISFSFLEQFWRSMTISISPTESLLSELIQRFLQGSKDLNQLVRDCKILRNPGPDPWFSRCPTAIWFEDKIRFLSIPISIGTFFGNFVNKIRSERFW